jgi:hypothetical protein
MAKNNKLRLAILPAYLAFFHVAFIVLMAIFGSYNPILGKEEVPFNYASKLIEN